MQFSLLHRDSGSAARRGLLETAHGSIETPIFMPVGTAGSVKAVHQRELTDEVQAQIILGNIYVRAWIPCRRPEGCMAL